jgi:predicted Zn-dependent protease
LFYEKERFADARDLLRHFVAQNPKDASAFALLGLSEYKTHEWERSLQHLQHAQAQGLEPRSELAGAVLYHQAVLLIRFEQYHDSLELLYEMRHAGIPQTDLEEPAGLASLGYPLLPEELPQPRRALARMAGVVTFARFDQRNDDADQVLRKMVEQYPDEPGVHYQYGLLLFMMDHSPEGIQEMQKELAITPWHVPSRLRLAEYYLDHSQPDQAHPYLEEVIAMEPTNSTAHLLRGQELTSAGDNAGAIRELELARQLAPERKKVLWALFRAYMAAGRQADADQIKSQIEKLKEAEFGE